MTSFLPILGALAGLYLGGVVIAALRSGTIRYRQARHSRTAEPRNYWLAVGWYGFLAVMSLGYALRWGYLELQQDVCLDRGGSWNADGGTCGGPITPPPPQ